METEKEKELFLELLRFAGVLETDIAKAKRALALIDKIRDKSEASNG